MSVYRIKKTKNYTIMSNYHLQDKNLSYKAKGLLSYMLSLSDNWKYSLKGLTKVSKEGIKSIRSTIKELEDNKYLVRIRSKDKDNNFYYEYNIYEIPYPMYKYEYLDSGHTLNGNIQEDTQINTNIISNNKIKINYVTDKKDILDNESDIWNLASIFDESTIKND